MLLYAECESSLLKMSVMKFPKREAYLPALAATLPLGLLGD